MERKVRVIIPYHLRNLAGTGHEVQVRVDGEVTVASVIAALETKFPVLKGTIRDHATLKRRDFLRFFASGEDISLEPMDALLPSAIAEGKEPLMVIGAIAGG